MSASDAAPLPRLGEVFFDVRGSSRSMRLSWYADTGIAVFSIWQGGMCTGTFRLPIGDLPRMIEILQRGPDDQEPPRPRQEHRAAEGQGYRETDHSGQREFRTGAILQPDREGQRRRPRSAAGREGPGATRRGSRHARGDTSGRSWSAQRSADEAADGPWSDYGHDPYGDQRHGLSESAGHRRDDEDKAPTAGYGTERFVPPYVRGGAGEYRNETPPPSADVLGEAHGRAYQEDFPYGRSQPADYDRELWPEGGYSERLGYRLPDQPAGSGDDSDY